MQLRPRFEKTFPEFHHFDRALVQGVTPRANQVALGVPATNVLQNNIYTKDSMKLAGIILISIGILAMVYQGFSFTETKQDAKLGPVEINHQETHNVPMPPIVGGACILAGVVTLVAGSRSNL
jgi:hypothetical protein